MYKAKTKAQSSCAVSAQLICTFVLAYGKIRFSHDAAQILVNHSIFNLNMSRF